MICKTNRYNKVTEKNKYYKLDLKKINRLIFDSWDLKRLKMNRRKDEILESDVIPDWWREQKAGSQYEHQEYGIPWV